MKKLRLPKRKHRGLPQNVDRVLYIGAGLKVERWVSRYRDAMIWRVLQEQRKTSKRRRKQ